MKKSIQLFISCIFLVTTMTQAQWVSNPNIKGNGTLISEKRTTTSYYKITVAGFFNVELILANEKNITIKGEENLLPNIKVEVIDQVLKIAAEKKINTSVPAKENKL